MGIKSFFQNIYKTEVLKDPELTKEVLRAAPEEMMRLENYVRAAASGRSGGKSITGGLTGNATFFSPKNIKDWNAAVQSATDPERPNFQFYQELCENLMLDAHLKSVIETRVNRVLRSKYDLISESGDTADAEIKKLLHRPWFEKFLFYTIMTRFTGIKVLELFDTNELGELIRCKDIPQGHLLPKRQEIAKEAGGETGTSYVSGTIKNYYVEVGEMEDLGLLSEIATYVLAKKKAMGAFLDYLHKYGVPPIIINTDNYDKQRQQELLDMGMQMHNNHVMVTQGNETFTLGQVPSGGNTNIFFDFIKLMNGEISKAVLGQDGTTEKGSTGSYSSLEVMQEVTNDRHESDKLLAQFVVNSQLLPRLPLINSFYKPLTGLTLDWDESDEMEQKDYVSSAVSLTQAGYELDLDELSERSGITIKSYKAPFGGGADPAEETEEDPTTKKKSPTNK